MLVQHLTRNHDPGWGVAVDVDDQYQVVLTSERQVMHATALAAVAAGRVTDHGILNVGSEHHGHGRVRCPCGRIVELTGDWEGSRYKCSNEYGPGSEVFRASWRDIGRETGKLGDDKL